MEGNYFYYFISILLLILKLILIIVSQLWIVMEYLEAGSLLDLMGEIVPSILDEESISYVMRELLIVR